MNCENVKPLIDPLVDNELPTETTAHVVEHISSCLGCQELWDSRTKLRERFRNFADKVDAPDGALERMDQKLESISFVLPGRSQWIAIAAAVILFIGLFTMFRLGNVQAVSPLQLASDFTGTTAAEPIDLGLSEVSSRVGFNVNPPDLGEWQLVSTNVCQVGNRQQCLAKLTYQRVAGEVVERVSLYQACAGKMNPDGLKEMVIAGRAVCCGQLGEVSVVYLKKQGMDNIMIGKMPEKQLMMLAMGV